MTDSDTLTSKLIKTLEAEAQKALSTYERAKHKLEVAQSLSEAKPEPVSSAVVPIKQSIPVARRETLSAAEHAVERERIRKQALQIQGEFLASDIMNQLYDGPVSVLIRSKVYNTLNKLISEGKLRKKMSSNNGRCHYEVLK